MPADGQPFRNVFLLGCKRGVGRTGETTPPSTHFPARQEPRRVWRRVGNAPLAVLLLALSGSENILSRAGADEEQPGHPSLNEIEITSRARHALLAEPRLKPLNLFVSVQQGVATLRGPVPSKELADLAVKVLDQVRGVYHVRNKLDVVAAPTQGDLFIPLNDPPPVHTKSASSPAASRGTLAGRNTRNPPETVIDLAPNPFPAPRTIDPLPPGVTMRTPEKLPDGTVVTPQPLPVAERLAALRGDIEQLRQREVRFRPLQADIRDLQTIWVYDDPWRGEDVAAFAGALRQFPGIRSVVIKNLTATVPR